jgi:hypothetical protein
MRHERRPQTAFVLSGGASLGALQAGMLARAAGGVRPLTRASGVPAIATAR